MRATLCPNSAFFSFGKDGEGLMARVLREMFVHWCSPSHTMTAIIRITSKTRIVILPAVTLWHAVSFGIVFSTESRLPISLRQVNAALFFLARTGYA
jgi:hypothetical protein